MSISEIVETLGEGESETEICATAEARYDSSTQKVSVTLDSFARCVFAENDFAFSMIDLADRVLMPTLLETELVDVEIQRAGHVGDKEHRTGVPPLNSLVLRGVLTHSQLLVHPP